MIQAEFFTSEGAVIKVKVSGHSGYSEAGSDIVCASVSSAVIMTANTITEIMKLPAVVTAITDSGFVKISLDKENADKCQDILQGLKLHLDNIEMQYSEFLKVITTEV